jgi:hypothetical protein
MSLGALRDAVFQHLGAFVDERVDAALDDLLVGDLAARDAGFARAVLDQRSHLGIGQRRAAAGFVAVEAGAGLLAEAAHLAQAIAIFGE